MRILQVTPGYPPMLGGVENSVHELVNRLRSLNHKVYVVTASPDRPSIDGNVWRMPVRFKLERNWGDLIFCPSILSALKEIPFEIVHTHTPRKLFSEFVALHKLLTRRKFPYIVSVRLLNTSLTPFLDAFSNIYRRTVEKMLFRNAETVIVQTKANKRFLIKNCGIKAEKIEIIPNAVDSGLFDPRLFDPDRIREKYEISGDNIILFAGRLTTQKGLEYLLRAIALVKREIQHFKLLLVGKGPQENALKDLSAALGIADYVFFLGDIPHCRMPELYSLADIFVLPSLSESFPNAMLEAMAMEKPVVATRVGVIPEIIVNGESAITVKPGETRQLADEIVRVLSDEKLSKRIAFNGRKLVTTKFTWDYVVGRTVQLYEKALS